MKRKKCEKKSLERHLMSLLRQGKVVRDDADDQTWWTATEALVNKYKDVPDEKLMLNHVFDEEE